MTDSFETSRPSHPGAILRGVMIVAAILVLLGGFAISGLLTANHNPITPDIALAAIGVLLAGIFLAAMLAAASAIVGMLGSMATREGPVAVDDVRPALDRLEQSMRMLNNLQTRDAARPGAAENVQGSLNGTGRPLQLLEQIRDLTLMSDEQLKRYASRHWAHRKETHLEAIERDVLVGDWMAAFARLEELQIVLPGDTDVAQMRERVESEQSSRLEEDVRVARGRLRQLMNASLWPQAEELAAGLVQKYPGKADADRLVEDVRRERDAWERENMDRLFRDIEAATENRQWRHAILALEEFVRRYPLDPRAEALRLDLPMLQENAAAHERKEQEEHFKDLLKRQRYEEALNVARGVISKYPQSPTATELTKLLPRVEEFARQQEAARVAAQNAPSAAPATAAQA